MLGIKELLLKILLFIGAIDDYVVDTGTSGIWTYHKWNNGFVDCVGQINPTLTWSAYTGIFYMSNTTVAFPFTVTGAQLKGSMAYCGGNIGWVANCYTNSSTQGQVYMVRNGNSGNVTVNLYLTGRWK